MLETLCLRLAAGLAFSLLAIPARVVSSRFYRTHLLVTLCLLVTAGVFAWERAVDEAFLWAGLGASAGLAVITFWFWSADRVGVGAVALVLLTMALFVALFSLPGAPGASGSWVSWLANEGTAAAFLGMAMTAMLMGHWYLIAPTMSTAPLLRLLASLAIANVARLLAATQCLWHAAESAIPLDQLAWLLLAVRWSVGLLAPLGLTWMAWQAARIRSTQSATGILYVVVIFVFFGELTDQILQEHLATLGGGTA